jgi:hypothetical protein
VRAVEAGKVDGLLLLAGAYEPFEELFGEWKLQRAVQIVPGIGKGRAFDALAICDLNPVMRVKALTPEQRAQLVETARRLAGKRWLPGEYGR